MLSTTTLMPALGLTGLFASRVFVPMFAAAMVMRFGPQIGLIDDWGLLAAVSSQNPPNWFTHDLTLLVLGVLAAAEVTAHKVPESRELLNLVDRFGKPVAAAATYLGILSVSDRDFVQDVVAQAGLGDYLLVAVVAGGVWVVGSAHDSLFGTVTQIDEDDDSGIVGLLSWAQDGWALFGILFLILFPVVMAVLILLVVGLILLLQKRAAAREERSKVPCANCGESMYRSAMACASCSQPNATPTSLNWLGASTQTPVGDLQRHPLHLVSKRRCRQCATRLPERSPLQCCPACQARPFEQASFVQAYDNMVTERVPMVLLVCGLLSLVPVVGLIPGVILYRMTLVAPYRRYVGRARSFLLRWGIRLLFLVLMMFQWVPVAGGLVVPTMAMMNYSAYRRAFNRQLEHQSARHASPPVTEQT